VGCKELVGESLLQGCTVVQGRAQEPMALMF